MGVETGIAWTHHTFNGWISCTERGPECLNCYAREQNKFYKWNGGTWGPGAPRKVTSPENWRKPLAWNRAAEAAKERRRVFAFSLADVADAEAPAQMYPLLWAMVEATPWLDWLFLTKRPERINLIIPEAWKAAPPHNVWWGTSVGTQKTAERAVHALLQVKAVVHFLSMEPLLEAVDLTRIKVGPFGALDALRGGSWMSSRSDSFVNHSDIDRVNWVICGGESGGHARSMNIKWARSIADQCKAAGTACFFKQTGVAPVMDEAAWRALPSAPLVKAGGYDADGLVQLAVPDKHGGIPEAWPGGAVAWPRQFPEVKRV